MITTTVQNIAYAVSQLSPEELANFCAWFAEFDAQKWEQQLENDVRLGKLDALANQALKDLAEGHCTDL